MNLTVPNTSLWIIRTCRCCQEASGRRRVPSGPSLPWGCPGWGEPCPAALSLHSGWLCSPALPQGTEEGEGKPRQTTKRYNNGNGSAKQKQKPARPLPEGNAYSKRIKPQGCKQNNAVKHLPLQDLVLGPRIPSLAIVLVLSSPSLTPGGSVRAPPLPQEPDPYVLGMRPWQGEKALLSEITKKRLYLALAIHHRINISICSEKLIPLRAVIHRTA